MMRQTIGVFVVILSVVISLSLFVGGLAYYKHLVAEADAAGVSYDEQVNQIGPICILFIVGSLVTGCTGFFVGLYLINPWLPAAYLVAKRYHNSGEV